MFLPLSLELITYHYYLSCIHLYAQTAISIIVLRRKGVAGKKAGIPLESAGDSVDTILII